MRKWVVGFIMMNLVAVASAQQTERNKLIKNRVVLPHGWALTPAGHTLPLGELPRNMAVSPTGKYLVVTNNGQNEITGNGGNMGTLQLIETSKEKVLDATGIPASCMGLRFSEDGRHVYAAGGNGNSILKYAIIRNKLVLSDNIVPDKKWQGKIVPEALDIDDKKHLLYVVTREDHGLYIFDLEKKSIVQHVDLEGEGANCLLSNDKEWLYILCRGSDKALIFDTRTARITGSVKVGNDPNDLCLTRDGHFLFVASNDSHSVSIIDVPQQKVIQTLNVALFSGVPSISAANALTLSEDEKTLYVANADNNCLVVWDISQPATAQIKGFVPVGWYPTSVKMTDGKLFVANGKGFSSLAGASHNDKPGSAGSHIRYHNGANDWSKEVRYILGLFTGSLSVIDEPEDKLLGVYSQLVYQNCPYHRVKKLSNQAQTSQQTAETREPVPSGQEALTMK